MVQASLVKLILCLERLQFDWNRARTDSEYWSAFTASLLSSLPIASDIFADGIQSALCLQNTDRAFARLSCLLSHIQSSSEDGRNSDISAYLCFYESKLILSTVQPQLTRFIMDLFTHGVSLPRRIRLFVGDISSDIHLPYQAYLATETNEDSRLQFIFIRRNPPDEKQKYMTTWSTTLQTILTDLDMVMAAKEPRSSQSSSRMCQVDPISGIVSQQSTNDGGNLVFRRLHHQLNADERLGEVYERQGDLIRHARRMHGQETYAEYVLK